MRRRQFIVVLSGIAALARTGGAGRRPDRGPRSRDQQQFGIFAQPGDEMEKGMALYVKEHEKDLPPGVKVELLRRDDAAAPRPASGWRRS